MADILWKLLILLQLLQEDTVQRQKGFKRGALRKRETHFVYSLLLKDRRISILQ